MKLFREKKWLPILAVVLLVAVICLVLFIVLRDRTAADDLSNAEVPGITLDEEAVWGTAPEETLGLPVETPYLTFHYPAEWENSVEVASQTESGRSCTVFCTELSGKKVELFSVILSPEEENGYLLGRLKAQDGSFVNVYTCVNELEAAVWSEEDYAMLCTMQERVNDIIAQIYENSAFVPN